MKKDYHVRPYQHGDEEEIVQLLQLAFDGWPHFDLSSTPLDHWKWKYLDTPYKNNDITVAVSGNKIIGCKHSIPLNIKVKDESYFCNLGTDLGVHPEFRGFGVSQAIRDLNKELKKKCGYQFTYFITSNPIMVESYSRSSPRFPHNISNLVKILDINKQLQIMPVQNPWLIKIGFHASNFLNNFRNVFTRSENVYSEQDIQEVKSFDAKIDAFWTRISKHYDFIVERSRNYLNWRFCDPRAGDFIIKLIEEDRQVLGYIVLKINKYRREYPIGYIVDMHVLPDQLEVANALVADAIKYFEEENINIINYLTVKGHQYERILNLHGFLDSRHKIYLFLGRSILLKYPHLLNEIKECPARRVYFSYGDIDSIPYRMINDR